MILLAVLAMGFMWIVATSSASLAQTLNMMIGSPNRVVSEESEETFSKRGGELLYWAVFGFMAGQIVRAVANNWLVIIILMIALSAVLWAVVRPVYQRNGGRAASIIGLAIVTAGTFAGVMVRQIGAWPVSIVAIVALVAITMMVRRPEQSGFLKKP